jgi:hypothetical protein
MQMEAEQAEAESKLSCCWTNITSKWLCADCREPCK